MKKIIPFIFALSSLSYASYECQGTKGTTLEKFTILKLTANEIATTLDGGVEQVTELEGNRLNYFYHNGCDNEINFKIHSLVAKRQPKLFSMKVDYQTEEEILFDSEVICKKVK